MIDYRFKGVEVTKRDLGLFELLFQFKVADIGQIYRHCYPGAGLNNVYARLKKLERAKLIKSSGHEKNGRLCKIYHLTKLGMEFIADLYPENKRNYKLKSDSPYHDLVLLDIAKKIVEIDEVEDYTPENLIQSNPSFVEDRGFSDFAEFRSDAFFNLVLPEDTYKVALEYEHTVKSFSRYRTMVTNYYLSLVVDLIFCIYKEKSAMKKIAQAEERDWTKNPSKFFFCSIEEFQNSREKNVFASRFDQFVDF